MGIRRMIAALFVALLAVGAAACGTEPPPSEPPPPISVGDCYAKSDANLSFSYLGPDNTFQNAEIHTTSDCTGPVVLLSTVVLASDSSSALTSCQAANAAYGVTDQLTAEGWTSSGTSTPISDQVWGCGPPV